MPATSPLRLSLLSLLLALPSVAVAGPYEVGSTSTAKGLKFKNNLQWKHSDSKDTWVLPKFGIGGPLNERLELSIGTGYGVVDRTGGTTRGGLRDLSVGLKWRMLDEGDAWPAVTIEPELSVPTGDDRAGIGAGAYAFELPLRAGRQFGNLRLTGEISASRTFGRDQDQVGAGVLLEYFGARSGPRAWSWSPTVRAATSAPCTCAPTSAPSARSASTWNGRRWPAAAWRTGAARRRPRSSWCSNTRCSAEGPVRRGVRRRPRLPARS
ncbi:MAG: hypothetical protein QM761_10455 [Pseudoxanthomonas sp.]